MAHVRAATVERVEPVLATGRGVSWGAISAGVVFAVVTQMLLSLLGAGIGLASIEPGEQGAGAAKALGIGAAAWWVVSALVSMYAGGWMAARLSDSERLSDGVYHGILMWCVSTLVSVMLLTSAVGGILGGTMGFVGKAFGVGSQQAQATGGAGQALERAAERQGINVDAIQSRAQQGDLAGAARSLGEQTQRAAGGPEATQRAEARATQAADTAADVGGAAFLIALAALLIGAVSAGFGGRVGYYRAVRLATVTGTTL